MLRPRLPGDTCLPGAIRTLALALVLNVYGVEVRAAPVVLLCSGTMQALYTGSGYTHRGSNSTNETFSIEIDVAAKTLTIDGETWPLTGDTSGTVITSGGSKDDATLSVSLNRITGAVAFIFENRSEMLRLHQEFSGVCKAGQKLF
jgi:hypothetical protein